MDAFMRQGTMKIVAGVLVLAGVAFSAESPAPAPRPEFADPAAQQAQAVRDKAIAAAWEAYQAQVRKADQVYVETLKLAYSAAMKAEKLEEALKLKKEIEAFQLDVKTGLVLYYDFDQQPVGGVVKDASGQNNSGKATGAKWLPTGRFGGAMQFNIANKTDGITVSDSDSLDVKQITISVWIKTTDNDEFWNRIVDKDYRKGYNLCLGGDYQGNQFRGRVYFECNDKNIRSESLLNDGQWHHIAAIYDGSEMRMFVDGKKQKGVNKWVGELAANNYDLCVGNTKIPYEPWEFLAFDGAIDELRIYNRPLTEKEVNLLYTTQGK